MCDPGIIFSQSNGYQNERIWWRREDTEMDSWSVRSLCENILMPWTKGQRRNSLLWVLSRVQAIARGNSSHDRQMWNLLTSWGEYSQHKPVARLSDSQAGREYGAGYRNNISSNVRFWHHSLLVRDSQGLIAGGGGVLLHLWKSGRKLLHSTVTWTATRF